MMEKILQCLIVIFRVYVLVELAPIITWPPKAPRCLPSVKKNKISPFRKEIYRSRKKEGRKTPWLKSNFEHWTYIFFVIPRWFTVTWLRDLKTYLLGILSSSSFKPQRIHHSRIQRCHDRNRNDPSNKETSGTVSFWEPVWFRPVFHTEIGFFVKVDC